MKLIMNFRKSQVRIKVILSIAFALVLVLGILTYQNLAGLVNQASNAAKPDLTLLEIKSITNEIASGELLVKSYTLKNDTSIISKYTHNFQRIDHRLSSLRNESQSTAMTHLIDSISGLMDQKFGLITSLFEVQNAKGVEKVFDKISKELNKEHLDNEANDNSESLLKRIFKRKENKASVDLDRVKHEVQDIKKQEVAQEYAVNNTELQLTKQIDSLDEMVGSIIAQMEHLKMAEIKGEIAHSETKAERAKTVVLVFCFFTGILIIISFYLIQQYLGKNRAYQKAMKKAKEDAEELAAAKERFLANMSHEIRTPLNAVVGFVEQLKKTNLKPAQADQLDMIDKSSAHLLHVVNEVLDYSKLQANKLRLIKSGFSIADTIDEVLAMLRLKASEKGLEIIPFVEKGIPEMVLGDKFRLKQILINLLGNSIKFTPQGRIELHAKPKLLNEHGVTMQFSIIDTGVGISSDHLSRIFNEFEQVKSDTQAHYQGTGLGLAISKHLVDLHGGKIEIESAPGKGTKVTIALPYAIENEKEALEKPSVARQDLTGLPSLLTNKKILIVDDESYNRKLIYSILEKYKPALTTANDGKEALDEVKKEKYDLILMDLRMPVMTGMEATAEIRSLKNRQKMEVPIIIISAALSEEDEKKSYEAGVNGFLKKPFHESQLLEQILTLFSHPIEMEKAPTPVDEAAKNGKSTHELFNLNDLNHMSQTNPGIVSEMLNLFIETSEKGLTDLRHHLENKNYAAIANTAHRMISPCRHLEMLSLIQLLEELEENCKNGQSKEAVATIVQQLAEQLEIVSGELRKYLQAVS
ncbi:response regulator [bacterium]|nr:response regulator [bacterium]